MFLIRRFIDELCLELFVQDTSSPRSAIIHLSEFRPVGQLWGRRG